MHAVQQAAAGAHIKLYGRNACEARQPEAVAGSGITNDEIGLQRFDLLWWC